MHTIFLIYLFFINLTGYAMMGIDKKRAVRGAWRISEASLFWVALAGGALGCTLGMHRFRHKTRHWYFLYGIPAMLAVHLLLAFFIWKGPVQFILL